MTGISRGLRGRASWLCIALTACGGRASSTAEAPGPSAPRLIPQASAIVLETAGPAPSDTTVTFLTGQRRAIILRHGPPENVVFAELWFMPETFGASGGREVRVEVRPRPGVYGLEVSSSLPIGPGASLVFKYPRFFSAPARARAVYGNDAVYERALAVGQLQTNGMLSLLPSTRPAADVLRAPLPAAGSYVVAAPQ